MQSGRFFSVEFIYIWIVILTTVPAFLSLATTQYKVILNSERKELQVFNK